MFDGVINGECLEHPSCFKRKNATRVLGNIQAGDAQRHMEGIDLLGGREINNGHILLAVFHGQGNRPDLQDECGGQL